MAAEISIATFVWRSIDAALVSGHAEQEKEGWNHDGIMIKRVFTTVPQSRPEAWEYLHRTDA